MPFTRHAGVSADPSKDLWPCIETINCAFHLKATGPSVGQPSLGKAGQAVDPSKTLNERDSGGRGRVAMLPWTRARRMHPTAPGRLCHLGRRRCCLAPQKLEVALRPGHTARQHASTVWSPIGIQNVGVRFMQPIDSCGLLRGVSWCSGRHSRRHWLACAWAVSVFQGKFVTADKVRPRGRVGEVRTILKEE